MNKTLKKAWAMMFYLGVRSTIKSSLKHLDRIIKSQYTEEKEAELLPLILFRNSLKKRLLKIDRENYLND